jgi:hypothetical protein
VSQGFVAVAPDGFPIVLDFHNGFAIYYPQRETHLGSKNYTAHSLSLPSRNSEALIFIVCQNYSSNPTTPLLQQITVRLAAARCCFIVPTILDFFAVLYPLFWVVLKKVF